MKPSIAELQKAALSKRPVWLLVTGEAKYLKEEGFPPHFRGWQAILILSVRPHAPQPNVQGLLYEGSANNLKLKSLPPQSIPLNYILDIGEVNGCFEDVPEASTASAQSTTEGQDPVEAMLVKLSELSDSDAQVHFDPQVQQFTVTWRQQPQGACCQAQHQQLQRALIMATHLEASFHL